MTGLIAEVPVHKLRRPKAIIQPDMAKEPKRPGSRRTNGATADLCESSLRSHLKALCGLCR